MFIITSNTPYEIYLDVVRDGDRIEKVCLNKKFSTTTSEKLTSDMIYLDSKGIIKYAETKEVHNDTSDNQSDNNSNRRGRRRNRNNDNTEGSDEKSENSNNENESNEGGK